MLQKYDDKNTNRQEFENQAGNGLVLKNGFRKAKRRIKMNE